MATITIRRLADETYEKLRERAQSNRRSLEAEVREILTEKTRGTEALIDQLIEFHAEMVSRHGTLPDSTSLLREMRDSE